MTRLLFRPLTLTVALSAPEAAKQTSAARLWLKIPAAQSPLRDLQVSSGTATPA